MKLPVKIVTGILLIGLAVVLIFFQSNRHLAKPDPVPTPNPETAIVPNLPYPINHPQARAAKKLFGTHVAPGDSPVSPERFSGYHTGVDFETLPEEKDAPIPFYAICDGSILQKRTATGYGGIIVQSCNIQNQAVTVVYGHVSIASVAKKPGDNLSAGETIGDLGQSPSETDGERKHLHLGIHKGSTVDVRGYVQSQSELSDWIDFLSLE